MDTHVFHDTNIVEILRTIEAQCASVRNDLGNFEPTRGYLAPILRGVPTKSNRKVTTKERDDGDS